MEKRITIYQGDEFRAKIEKKIEKDSFFAEVYVQAYDMLNEITSEMDQYIEDNKIGKGNSKINFQGMGNNIINFCGERGQGKTTALRTFVSCLTGYTDTSEIEGEVHQREVFEGVKNRKFFVLDSIDPSALESGESIIRVLVSRLFFEYERQIKRRYKNEENDRVFQTKKTETLKIFRQCYTDIDYLKLNREKEWERDDLDYLSQLGNSAQLKIHLYDLIKECLSVFGVDDDNDKQKTCRDRYLVVPVDDADLATSRIYEICEDIRNYFAIPNVIILMANNYEQLTYAIYQKYLSDHEQLVKMEKDLAMSKKCYDMAVRYLEKVFPLGHRIYLPQVNSLMVESPEKVVISYLAREEENLFKNNENLDFQIQLLELLYRRTGIVLLKRTDEVHPFLPHTMRELTHFCKLLFDMEEIECDTVYFSAENSTDEVNSRKDVMLDIIKLKENLASVKRYFMDYWCRKNLDIAETDIIVRVDAANQRHDMDEVYSIVISHKNDDASNEPPGQNTTFAQFMKAAAQNGLRNREQLQEAIYIYYTIYMNEWFADALERNTEYERIADFVERPLVFLEEEKLGLYKNQYHIMDFKVETAMLRRFLNKVDLLGGKQAVSISMSCTAIRDEEKFDLLENPEDIVWSPDIKEIEFNVLQPIINVLRKRNIPVEEVSNQSVDGNDAGKKVPTIKNAYLVSARNIMANCDVQKCVQEKIEEYYVELNRQENTSWDKICERIYQEIDSWRDRAEYSDSVMGRVRKFSDFCNEYMQDGKLMTGIFLSNTQNAKEYLKNYKSQIDKFIKKEQAYLSQMKDDNIKDLVKEIYDGREKRRYETSDWSDGLPIRSKLLKEYKPEDEVYENIIKIDRIVDKMEVEHTNCVESIQKSLGEELPSKEEERPSEEKNKEEKEKKNLDNQIKKSAQATIDAYFAILSSCSNELEKINADEV